MSKHLKWVCWICLFGCLATGALWAKDLPERPHGYVSDATGILSQQQQYSIEMLAAELENKTTAQLAVVIVPSVRPETIEQYAVRLFEKWGIGRHLKNNGVLFLIAVQDREVRLEVGYGLEGFLTDAVSRSIIERFIIPAFRQGKYDQGVQAGAAAIVGIIAKEYGVTVTGQEDEVFQTVHRESDNPSEAFALIMFLAMLIFFILNPRLFLYTMMFSSMGGRGGSWSGGGGGFGGGFGGFGGGMSGGGGASGRW
jgi:uncharacterized protein